MLSYNISLLKAEFLTTPSKFPLIKPTSVWCKWWASFQIM